MVFGSRSHTRGLIFIRPLFSLSPVPWVMKTSPGRLNLWNICPSMYTNPFCNGKYSRTNTENTINNERDEEKINSDQK